MAATRGRAPEGAAQASAALAPASVDWDAVDGAQVEQMLLQLERFCGGRGHPELPRAPVFEPGEKRPYMENALGVVRWALLLCGGVENDQAEYYDDAVANHVCMDRFFYLWEIYKRYHRFQLQEGADAERDRDMIHRFSYCYEVMHRVHQIQGCVFDCYRLLLNSSDYVVPECLAKSSTHLSLLRLWSQSEEEKKKSDYEELIMYLLSCAAAHRYRKSGTTVFQEKFVHYAGKKYGTRAWEPATFDTLRPEVEASSMEAFIHRFCRKEHRADMWSRLVNLKGHDKLRDYLAICEDIEFPFLRPCRNLLAFQNGIYDTRGGTGGTFYDYSIVGRHLRSELAAAKFFDTKLDSSWIGTAQHKSWWEIPTPLFQSILDYQNWGVPSTIRPDGEEPRMVDKLAAEVRRAFADAADEVDALLYGLQQDAEADAPHALQDVLRACRTCVAAAEDAAKRASDAVDTSAPSAPAGPKQRTAGAAFPIEAQRWVYVFLGRMLHALGDYDSWQIIPFFKGRGGSGKSTVAHVAKNFFAADDVGILINNSVKKFGLQSLVDKLVFICFELKKNVSLDQAEFQSMVSGEDVCVAIKNQGARVVRWRSPGLLCGNEAPGWVDAQGSIARRLAIFGFKYGISEKHSDPELLKRIETGELAALIVKSNCAYRDTAESHRGEDFWRIVPSYFKEERLSLQRDTDPLCATLWDETVYELAYRDKVADPENCFMPFVDFETDYKRRYRELRGNVPVETLNRDKYATPFEEALVEAVFCTRTYNEVIRQEMFLIGIRPRRTAAGAVPLQP
jgi:hypothetical protein